MKSLPRRIIRGAEVEGVSFCSSKGQAASSGKTIEEKEEDSLQALELFWEKKGFAAGQEAGFKEGIEEGKKEGENKGQKAGYDEGFKAGEQAGEESALKNIDKQAEEELHATIDLLKGAAGNLENERNNMLKEAKQELLNLSIAICEKFLRRELKDKKSMTKLIEDLLVRMKSITHDQITHIFLSPDDFHLLEKQFSKIQYDKSDIKKLDFASDPAIEQGECRIETALGLINFDIPRLLDNLLEDLTDK